MQEQVIRKGQFRLVRQVIQFIETRGLGKTGPLLLGYSGGPDSRALLHLLLESRKRYPFTLILLHVDHGWRKESGDEAETIFQQARTLELELHCKKLECQTMQEELARNARMAFFQEIYNESKADGLFLGHQADDQAETILKRLLEGAHPMHWKGIEPDRMWGEMRVLRPLLDVSKKTLQKWLAEEGIQPFEDPTNRDARFLRGRMRQSILPWLSQQFGKEIFGNLGRIGGVSQEWDRYLSRRCTPYLTRLRTQGDELHWDLSDITERLELDWLLKHWLVNQGLKASFQVLEGVAKALLERSSGKRFKIDEIEFVVRRGCLICFNFKNKQSTN